MILSMLYDINFIIGLLITLLLFAIVSFYFTQKFDEQNDKIGAISMVVRAMADELNFIKNNTQFNNNNVNVNANNDSVANAHVDYTDDHPLELEELEELEEVNATANNEEKEVYAIDLAKMDGSLSSNNVTLINVSDDDDDSESDSGSTDDDSESDSESDSDSESESDSDEEGFSIGEEGEEEEEGYENENLKFFEKQNNITRIIKLNCDDVCDIDAGANTDADAHDLKPDFLISAHDLININVDDLDNLNGLINADYLIDDDDVDELNDIVDNLVNLDKLDNNESPELKIINVVPQEAQINIYDMLVGAADDSIALKKINITTDADSKKNNEVDYKKMSLNQLRSTVVENNLCVDASKLKKHELFKLLNAHAAFPINNKQ